PRARMPPPGTSSTYAIVARSISLQLKTSNYECAARHAPMHEWQRRSARLARVRDRNGPAAASAAGTAVLDSIAGARVSRKRSLAASRADARIRRAGGELSV